MENIKAVSDQRSRFSYFTANLRPRDEMVFKTLLRLLASKLEHRWEFAENEGHLLIWGDQSLSDLANGIVAKPPQHSGQTLWLGQTPDAHSHYLTLPLLPARVEEQLNRLGHLLLEREKQPLPAPLAAQVSQIAKPNALPEQRSDMPQHSPAARFDWTDTKLRFKLKRWPPQDCVATSSRIKMATSMLAVPLSVANLCERGASNHRECIEFLMLLHARSVLQILLGNEPSPIALTVQTALRPPAKEKPTPLREGLLARIRHRLGL